MSRGGQNALFPNTRWTLVDRASGRAAGDAERALGELLQLYLPALKTHLLHAWRLSHHDADDVLHSFVADKVVMGALIERADRDRGRFRKFLLSSLEHYLISLKRSEQAQRRSPGKDALISLETLAEQMEIPDPRGGSHAFDLMWLREIVGEALRRVEGECTRTDRASYWAIFEERVVNPCLHGIRPRTYEEIVDRLAFESPSQASNALLTAKRMFMRTFLAVIREYTGSEAGANQEFKDLRDALHHFDIS